MKNPEMVSFINKVQFSCHQNVVSIANTFLARVANRKYSFKGQGEFLANILKIQVNLHFTEFYCRPVTNI